MPRNLIRLVAAGLVAAALSVPAFAANVVETAAGAGQFRTLLAAAKAAGLAESLATTAPITVFAPTDAAFAKLPPGTVEDLLRPENKEKLRGILAYHVVASEIPAAAVPRKSTRVETLNPSFKLHAVRRNGRVLVNGVRVVKADIRADNGIIHVIDRVLIPGAR